MRCFCCTMILRFDGSPWLRGSRPFQTTNQSRMCNGCPHSCQMTHLFFGRTCPCDTFRAFILSMLDGVPEYVTSTTPDQRSPESTHVLVVDDDSSIRQMVVDYLGDNEMKVTALASGGDIARVTGQQMIDLLI